MKKLLILLAAAALVACDKKHEPEADKQPHFLVGEWRTTHQEFSRSVNGVPQQHTLVDVSEAESYELRFKEDGTGFGLGVRLDGEGRYSFLFAWEQTDVLLKIKETKAGYGGVFFTYDRTALGEVDWTIESADTHKMVLVKTDWILFDGDIGPWEETHTYRYTFERVK